jgi:glucose/mannose-6-phosphate isomerase
MYSETTHKVTKSYRKITNFIFYNITNKRMNLENLKNLDKSNMFATLKEFPEQVRDACEIGKNIDFADKLENFDRILILGMGGSAIGGDLLRSYLSESSDTNHVEIIINRDYSFPPNLVKNSLVIASSYSGNTEETLSGVRLALEHTKNIVCITTGGELEKIAKENNLNIIKVPEGFQPRCALGYSFFPLLYLVMKSGALDNSVVGKIGNEINSTIKKLELLSNIYSDENFSKDSNKNISLNIARKLEDKIPIIYTSRAMETVGLRWRGQFQENSKRAAFGSVLPEMNHNEINSWQYSTDFNRGFTFLLLEDNLDHKQVSKRFSYLEKVLKDENRDVIKLRSGADFHLERMFDMIYLIDWASFWLAILSEKDPTAIDIILGLKAELSK